MTTDSSYAVLASTQRFSGRVISVQSDVVEMPGGGSATRDIVVHPGAVGVVVLDDAEQVLMIRQYRHAVRSYLWELPAGLLDVDGESAADTAARELAEEAGVTAKRWSVLVDALSSPGMSNEAFRVYLARGLSAKAHDFVAGPDEESDMQEEWVPLTLAVSRVLAGELTNGLAVIGILATAAARQNGYQDVRPVDSPWQARPDRA